MVWVKRLPRVMAPERNWRRQLLQADRNGIRTINGCFATLAALKRELSERKAPQLHARVDRGTRHCHRRRAMGAGSKIYRQTLLKAKGPCDG